MRWVDAARARLRLLFDRRAAESRMHDEFRFHIEMESDRLRRAKGLAPDEARRQALTAFGGVEKHKELLRDGRGLAWLSGVSLDVKLGLRMLAKYPGLTLAGGLALTIAIGMGAAWYDLWGDLLRPRLPLADGGRIVEIAMRDSSGGENEPRLLHDFLSWRRDLRSIEELGAYRTLERNLAIGDARPEPVTLAEITASAFRLARVPPLLGRPLLDADEQPGAPPVVVLGYGVWQRHFNGQADVIGRVVRLGRSMTTVVGVMPEGFAFPVNHRLWTALQLRPSGYAPVEGAAIRVFGRIAPNATQAHANAEVTSFVQRVAAVSPQTHAHLRPRVLAYGGYSPGDRSAMEFAITQLPILLVLIVACSNVGTLIYARTATRESEIAMRHALGAGRARIITQLSVEALVLAAIAAGLGLVLAHWGLKWGMAAYAAGQSDALPFWIRPGLKVTTVLYAMGLTLAAATILGVFPAFNATGSHAQMQLKNLARGSALRFGWLWSTVMIAQVALTVICLPPAIGIAHEAIRDRLIRERFPAEEYLAMRVVLDREPDLARDRKESASALAARLEAMYRELEQRVSEEPNVVAVTFAERLPGMGASVTGAEVEATPGDVPVPIRTLWMSAVGPRFFESFSIPVVAGRDFHDGDRAPGARTVLVNEAFARRYTHGASPVGRRVRYVSSDAAKPEPWLEIVGMVRDIGMTPTDLGEAPYVFRAVSPATASPLVMAVRVAGDPSALAPRVRAIAGDLDLRLRLDEVRSLDAVVWREDVPQMAIAGVLGAAVGLGLFLSAAGIFSLMSVSVARQTREIGLRAALGASPARLLAGIFWRVIALVGGGIVAGNLVLALVKFATELELPGVAYALALTSAVMLTVGLLACVEPARRALRIQPTDALKET